MYYHVCLVTRNLYLLNFQEVNQQGLTYIDVEIKLQPDFSDRRPVIIDDDERTNYSFVDSTKTADPLLDDANECYYENN